VRIEVLCNGGELEVDVTDDGRGVSATSGTPNESAWPRYGLAGMRERAAAIGGTLEIGAAQPSGTRVALRLPIAASMTGPAAGMTAGPR